jgi:hypothetical protein
MQVLRWTAVTAIGIAFCASAAGQQERDKLGDVDGFAFVLSPSALEKMLDAAVLRMGERYQMDDAQLEQTRKVFRDHVPRFLKENRQEMERLLNEFIETQAGQEAPSAEFAADWAKRAQPLLNKTREMIGGMTDSMRDYLSDEQQVQLDATLVAVDVAVNTTQTRLTRWSEGGYDPATEFHRNPGVRQMDETRARQVEQSMRAARDEAINTAYGGQSIAAADGAGQTVAAQAATPPAAEAAEPLALAAEAQAKAAKPGKAAAKAEPKDEWAAYVEKFAARYSLDADQVQKANAFLNAAKTERDNHLRAKASKMEQIEKKFKEARSPDATKAAEAQFQDLMKPVNAMFERLKDKLETLPRREQRKAAAGRETAQKNP